MSVRVHDEVWSTEDTGLVGKVTGVMSTSGLFKVEWYDDSVSIEAFDEEHKTWEKV